MDAHRPPADGTIDLGDVSTGRGDSSDPGSDAAGVLTIRALARRWAHWHDRRRWIVAALVAAGTLATLTGAAEPTAPPASQHYTVASGVEQSLLAADDDLLYTIEAGDEPHTGMLRAHDLAAQQVAWRVEVPGETMGLSLREAGGGTVALSYLAVADEGAARAGEVTVFDAATGQRLWSRAGDMWWSTPQWMVLRRPVSGRVPQPDTATGAPAGRPSQVAVVDRHTGTIEWSFPPTSLPDQPAGLVVHDGRLFLEYASVLYAFELATGERIAEADPAAVGGPQVVDQTLVTGRRLGDEHVLMGHDIDDLAHRWSLRREARGQLFSYPCGPLLCLYQEAGGTTTAVDPADGSTVWELPGDTYGDGLQPVRPVVAPVRGHVALLHEGALVLVETGSGAEAARFDGWRPPRQMITRRATGSANQPDGRTATFTIRDDGTLVYGEVRDDPLRVEPVAALPDTTECDAAAGAYLLCRPSGEGATGTVVWRLAG